MCSEFKFVLWERDHDGTWYLRSRSETRGPVEKDVRSTPENSIWCFVSQDHGVLAESINRP